jgi:hypothetical protein
MSGCGQHFAAEIKLGPLVHDAAPFGSPRNGFVSARQTPLGAADPQRSS